MISEIILGLFLVLWFMRVDVWAYVIKPYFELFLNKKTPKFKVGDIIIQIKDQKYLRVRLLQQIPIMLRLIDEDAEWFEVEILTDPDNRFRQNHHYDELINHRTGQPHIILHKRYINSTYRLAKSEEYPANIKFDGDLDKVLDDNN